MRGSVSTLFLLAAVAAHAAINPVAEIRPPTARERSQGYRDHVILAQPRRTHRDSVDATEAREGMRVRQKFARFGDLRVIVLDDADAADRAIARLRATGRYEFVERDRLMRAAVAPNDPSFSVQWALHNTGESGGVPGADIQALDAWDISHDAPNVVVAILDSGVNLNHQDITANLWRNPSPSFGDIHGASFVNGVRSGDPSDVQGHGTHCAGIVGATGHNGSLVTGVAWRVQIMAVRVMSAEGLITSSDFAAGVDYAIGHGAHILSVSLFTDTHAQSDLAILTAARDAGVLVAVAAGNAAANIDATNRYYPASYPLDNIVTVGSSNRFDQLSSFSNYGAAVDLVAPGESIASLYYASDTGGVFLSGTSMAAPQVAGALALLRAQFPHDTYRQLINRMLRGVERSPAFAGKAQTGGRLNLFNALTPGSNRPFNDDFTGRPALGGPTLAIRSNNVGAEPEAGEPPHAGVAGTSSLWWSWTAPASGPVSLDTVGSGYDTVLAVYTGSVLNALDRVVENDDNLPSQTSRVTFTAQGGTQYQIAVGGKNGAGGLTILNLGAPPPNDAFAGAGLLNGESTRIAANNLAASREPDEPTILGHPGGASVWYRWTAPRNGRFQISAASLHFDALLAVYAGSAVGGLAAVAVSDNIGPATSNTDALCTIDAIAGTTYHLAVDSKNGANTGEFTLSITDAAWQAVTLRNLNGAPAMGADGTLYVGSTDFTAYAFHPDGTSRWTLPTADALMRSTPAVAPDGTVYFHSLDGRLYAVRADGSLRWSHDFGVTPSMTVTALSSSPALAADGTIYLKAADGFLYALDPADGATRWRFNVGAIQTYAGPSIAADGTIYQGSSNGTLYALNPNGGLQWTAAAGGAIQTSPAIDAAGNLYFATTGVPQFISVNSAGTLRWRHLGLTGDVTSSPALSADGTTVYFGAGAGDRNLHALNTANGDSRWKLLLGAAVEDSSPAVDADGVIYIGATDGKLYAVHADGSLKRTYDTGGPINSSPLIAGTTLYVGSDDAKLYAFELGVGPAGGPWPQFHHNPRRTSRAMAPPAITAAPASVTVAAGSAVNLSVTASAAAGDAAPTFQWQRNGINVADATNSTLTIASVQPLDTGIYTVIARGALDTVSPPAVLGIATTAKVAGNGREIGTNIVHANGNTFDQILLEGAAASFTSDHTENQITRLSYIDLSNDIVQVEFSGPGSVSIVLAGATGPATAVNYDQPAVSYMKGHAGIVVTGATAATHLSIFSVGRGNAFDQSLFKGDVTYDGFADIAFIAIQSIDGKFGSLRTANASYFATAGVTGVYAPGVQFLGPVYVGNISASGNATPMLVIGSGSTTQINGGDLRQVNGRAVQVSGLSQLQFVDGSSSHHTATDPHLFPAQANRARLEENGIDVTAQVVVDPGP